MKGLKLRHLILLFNAILLGLGAMFPHRLWAYSALHLLHPVVQCVIYLLLASLVPEEGVRFWTKLTAWKADLFFEGSRWKAVVLAVFIGLILGIIGWQDNLLHGDAAQVIQRVLQFPHNLEFASNRFITVAIYAILIKPLAPFIGPFRSLMVLHILMGIGYMLLALSITRRIAKDSLSAFSIFVLFAGSGVYLVFNHIEVYGPALLAAMWAYMVLLFKDQEDRGIWFFLLPAALASILHPFFLYLFGFTALIYLHRYLPKFAMSTMIGATAIIAMGLGWADIQHTLPFKDNFTLFSQNPEYFFSLTHLLLAANFVLFVTPLVPVFLRYIGGDVSVDEAGTGSRDILIWGSFTTIIMVFLIDFKLGGCDWDLTSMMLLPLLLYIVFKIRRLDNRHLYTVSAILAAIFLFTHVATAITRDLEYQRGEQLSLKQGVPFLDKRYPGYNRFAYLATRVNDFLPDAETKELSLKYCLLANMERPHDHIGYLYLSKVYNMIDENNNAEIVLVDGMMQTDHDDKLRRALENLYKVEHMGVKQYAYPYFRPQPMTMRTTSATKINMDDAVRIVAAYAGVQPDSIENGMSFKYRKNDIRYDIRLLSDRFDIYAPILVMTGVQSPEARHIYLDILSTAWEDVRVGRTEPFKFFVEPMPGSGESMYIGTSLRYTNITAEILIDIIEKGEYFGEIYQKMFTEKGKGSYQYLQSY